MSMDKVVRKMLYCEASSLKKKKGVSLQSCTSERIALFRIELGFMTRQRKGRKQRRRVREGAGDEFNDYKLWMTTTAWIDTMEWRKERETVEGESSIGKERRRWMAGSNK